MTNHEPFDEAGPRVPAREGEPGSEATIERRFRRLLEAAPDAILEVDRDGRIVLMNAATEKLFGYTREELFGKEVDTLVPNEVRSRHVHHRADYSAHPLPRPMGSGLLLQGQRKDGTRFPVEISLSPFESDEGFRIGAIIRDITDRVKAEEQIRALQARYTEELTAANRQLELRNREVEAANQLKSEFLASMSHELRTPLHTIIGFAELLSEGLEGSLSDKQLRFVNHILRDGRHLLELINDILDLSKIEAGRLELKREEFEWIEALRDVIATIQPQAKAKDVALSSIETMLRRRICADRVRFKAILYNLLSNAVKFTPSGGKVWMDAGIKDESFVISVYDTGIGIPIEQQTRIFDKFYQAGMTTKGVREGTGLGLAITKHLVECHGGRITVDSTPGHGSCFTFTIPLEVRELKPLLSRRAGDAMKPLLLIVQPDAAPRAALATYLESQGYRTEVASSSDEVLIKVRDLNPDAITLDLLIAGTDGWNILRELRRTAETAKIPVLVVSVMEEAQDIVTSGADAYLVKPVDREILLSTLRQHVRTHPGNPSKILVVDDEPSSLQLLQEVLGGAGYLPILNSSGREALETLAKTQVSAVILDLLMPEMNGFDFICRVKEHPRFHDLPLLVLTAKELSGQDLELLRRDTKAVFLKASTWREELVAQLRKLIPAASIASER
jgi:PAS domain S-box-containing protein